MEYKFLGIRVKFNHSPAPPETGNRRESFRGSSLMRDWDPLFGRTYRLISVVNTDDTINHVARWQLDDRSTTNHLVQTESERDAGSAMQTRRTKYS